MTMQSLSGPLATTHCACVDWDSGSFFCAAGSVYRPIRARERLERPQALSAHLDREGLSRHCAHSPV